MYVEKFPKFLWVRVWVDSGAILNTIEKLYFQQKEPWSLRL